MKCLLLIIPALAGVALFLRRLFRVTTVPPSTVSTNDFQIFASAFDQVLNRKDEHE